MCVGVGWCGVGEVMSIFQPASQCYNNYMEASVSLSPPSLHLRSLPRILCRMTLDSPGLERSAILKACTNSCTGE